MDISTAWHLAFGYEDQKEFCIFNVSLASKISMIVHLQSESSISFNKKFLAWSVKGFLIIVDAKAVPASTEWPSPTSLLPQQCGVFQRI